MSNLQFETGESKTNSFFGVLLYYCWTRKPDLALTILASTLLICACSKKPVAEEAEPERTVTVEVAPVVNAPIHLKILGNGVVFPLNQAAIVPKISAPIKKFYVERGSHVREGQLLAELENKDLLGAVTEARAGFEQAQAQYEMASRGTVPEEVQKAELDTKAAKEVLDAQQKVYQSRLALFKEGAISEKEVNESLVSVTQARNQYEIAQKHLEATQRFGREQSLKSAAAQLEAAKGRYLSAEAQISYSRITSPINGVITDRPLFAGEMATSGSPLITVMDLSQVIVRPHISQQEAAKIKVGNGASLSIPGENDELPGKVTVVSPALDPNSTTVEIWVQFLNAGERLKPGTSVRTEIVVATVPNAMVIPASALLTHEDAATSVITVDAENRPHRKRVTTGIREGDSVQITEGLQSGERVASVGAYELDKLDDEVLKATKIQIQAPKAEGDEDEDDDDAK